ncbi:MAG: ABC transporter permease [Acidobacteriota bacterium]|jgi:predicted permease
MTQELKYAARGLLRAPGYAAVIVVTLALAIGATTTIYSVVNGVLLRPLPFPDQDRLLMLWQRAPGVGVTEDWWSVAQYFDIREGAPSLEHVALTFGQEVTLTGDDFEPLRLGALRVSSSFFDVMGIDAVAGRRFMTADDTADAATKVILGERLYTQQFGADPAIIGDTIMLDGNHIEVVGVLESMVLDGDMMATLVTVPSFDMLLSFPLDDPQTTQRGSENFNVIGKLAPDATRARLDAELLEVARAFSEDPGALGAGLAVGKEFWIGVVPLLDQVVGGARRYLLVLLGATAVLLAIACANVANLLLTRATTRRREISIRASLGAPRARMVTQAMLESLTLSLLGGAGGLLIAAAAVRALHLAAPQDLPRLRDVAVDPAVLAFAALLCVLSSVLFGLGPALSTSRVAPADVLRDGVAAVRARSPWRRGGSRLLVVAQVALSLLLVIGAGLLIRTFGELRTIDPGFRPSGALSFRVSPTGQRYATRDARVAFYRELFEGLRSLPGVQAAGGTSLLPLARGLAWTDFIVEGFNENNPDARIVADLMIVTPGYFDALGAEVIAGRAFTDADTDEPSVALVNRDFAERFWPAEEAVGKWLGSDFTEKTTIVGVVETVKHYGLDADTRPAVFLPHAAWGSRAMFGVLRLAEGSTAAGTGTPDPTALAPAVTRAVRTLDADLPVYDVRTMEDRLAQSLAKQRVLMWLLNFFGATALTLATVGLYGVLSFAVATHTRELGIRKALGAQRRDLYRLVLRSAGTVTLVGIGAGALIALWAASALDTVVFGIATHDPLAFAAAVLLVVAVAFAASLLPARKAASVDAMEAMK